MNYQNKLWSKTLIERLCKKGIGTNEQNHAFNKLKRNNDIKSFKYCINTNMNIAKNEAIKEEKL